MKIKKAYLLRFSFTDSVPIKALIGEDSELEGTLVGKVRPWNEDDSEYVVYNDGDLYLVEEDRGDGT